MKLYVIILIIEKYLCCNCLSLEEVDLGTQVQMLNEAVSISHRAISLRKGMNSTILPPAIYK